MDDTEPLTDAQAEASGTRRVTVERAPERRRPLSPATRVPSRMRMSREDAAEVRGSGSRLRRRGGR
jgi:hypothetical protein